MAGYKKHEIIKVAQENLFMLKRLNERTSFYNVDKWKKDYEVSQYYKRSHCQYPSIDFYKTQKYESLYNNNVLTEFPKSSSRKKLMSKKVLVVMGGFSAEREKSRFLHYVI